MRILYLAREYPPHVYGGAGVHLEYLAREMARLAHVEVRCFGDQNEVEGGVVVRGYPYGDGPFAGHRLPVGRALMTLETCLRFQVDPIDADVVHCHTWYSAWGGILAKIAYGIPLVVTVHSLEPLRPWKREQLGRGYDVSLWLERTSLELADAIIAVSESEKRRILSLFAVGANRVHVVPNGIDTQAYRRTTGRSALEGYGIAPDRPYVLSLGRLSRQKGLEHFLAAAGHLPPGVQVVLCAASPDAPEVEQDITAAVAALREQRTDVVWINDHLTRADAVELYSHATLFCCPSVYEPFGLINLEAMACETPVVASAVGGIPDVVAHGETGLLVPFEAVSPTDPQPADPDCYARDLGAAMGEVLEDPGRARAMGLRGREHVVRRFGWDRVAARIHALYREVLQRQGKGDDHEA